MRYIALIIIFMSFFATNLISEQYRWIEVSQKDYVPQEYLEKYGIEPHSTVRNGETVAFSANDYEISLLQKNSVSFSIISEDLPKELAKRFDNSLINKKDTKLSSDYQYGSMGGFATLEELYAQYDTLVARYPQLIYRDSIGNSYEGRPIFAYKIGNYASGSPFAMPEVLFTSLHHSNEPAGAAALIYFINDLFYNYKNKDEKTTYLLNHRLISVVPAVNPDGYEYNRRQNPNGGGMWRKNRRMVNDSTYGVDINRNYGPQEFWDHHAGGSSTDPKMVTYRGESPFSEPETQAIKSLCENSNFKIAVNYHSYGNMIVYPWGVLSADTPDSNQFRRFSYSASSLNKYIYGLDYQTLHYITQGNSDDWLYLNNDTKGKILSYTVEVGNSDDYFWPKADRIPALCQDNLMPNYEYLWSADYHFKVLSIDVNYSDKNKTTINIEIANIGNGIPPKTNPLYFKSLNPNILINNNEYYITALKSGDKVIAKFDIEYKNGFDNGSYVGFETIIMQNNIAFKDTFFLRLVKPEIEVLFDGTENNWELGYWGTIEDKVISSKILTDSPHGNSPSSLNNYLQYSKFIDLTSCNSADLVFRSKWFIEQNYDAGLVQVSTDLGLSWEFLTSSRMHIGLGVVNTKQDLGIPYLEGNIFDYINQTISLDEYCGNQIYLRFGMLTDNSTSYDGWSISDIYINKYDKYLSANNENDKQINNNSIIINKYSNIIIDNPLQLAYNYYFFTADGRLIASGQTINGDHNISTDTISLGNYVLLVDYGTKLVTIHYLIIE